MAEFNQRKTYRMHLWKKLFETVSLVALGMMLSALAYAQGSLHTKKILAYEPIPEKTLAQDQRKLNADYDSTIKYAVNCTIYALSHHTLSVTINVLSTYKINACDPDLFRATTAASIKAQLNTYQSIDRIIPIGPHIQLMDRNTSTVSNPYMSIGLMNYSKIASAHIGVKDIFTNLNTWRKWHSKVTFYNPIKMAESVNYVWQPGSTVYTLTSDKGVEYVMTHFQPATLDMQVKEIEETASTLAQRLNLPDGWRYSVKTLNKIMSIRRQEELGYTTLRVFDENGNVYIAIDQPIE